MLSRPPEVLSKLSYSVFLWLLSCLASDLPISFLPYASSLFSSPLSIFHEPDLSSRLSSSVKFYVNTLEAVLQQKGSAGVQQGAEWDKIFTKRGEMRIREAAPLEGASVGTECRSLTRCASAESGQLLLCTWDSQDH